MRSQKELVQAAEAAYQFLCGQPDIKECMVFVSSNRQAVARFNYTSHIPCNVVEEIKSTEDYGIGIHTVFQTPEGVKVGFGSEANNLSLSGVRIALEKARQGAVQDPEFHSLPKSTGYKRTLFDYHDPAMMEIGEEDFVSAAWKILSGAVMEFQNSKELLLFAVKANTNIPGLGLIAGGDLTVIAERIAVISTSLSEVQTDESTLATVSLTAMVEEYDAKGSGYGYYSKLSEINDAAGREAAQNAIRACGVIEGEKIQKPMSVPSGKYPIIFGSQPVTEFMNNLLLPSLTTETFFSSDSPFMGQMEKRITSPGINLYDDASNPKYPGAKGITCEGVPTKRVNLIVNGVLTDLLSSSYETQRTMNDPEAKAKLGLDPLTLVAAGKLAPVSGFRFQSGGGRGYDSTPSIAGTNSVLEGVNPVKLSDMMKDIAEGLYVGRIWYCYPINGLRKGDFTATVIADSYVIKNGKIFAPLKANAIRINDNIKRVLESVSSVSDAKRSTILWAADEITIAPDMLVQDVTVEEIGSIGALFTEE